MYSEWKGLFVGIIALLLGSVAQFLTPLLVGEVINILTESEINKVKTAQDAGNTSQTTLKSGLDWDRINFLCGWMILVFVASAGFTMIRGYTFNSMSEKIARHIRYDLVYFLINKNVGFYDENKTGELLSRIGGDT